MKKFNSFLFSIFMMLVCILPFQTASAVDVPLKSGSDPVTTFPRAMARLSVAKVSALNVSVALEGTELIVDFSSSVGVAQITVEDQNGGVVYQDVINTDSTLESVIETSGWDGGNYTVHIAYSSKKLVGTFQL